MSLDPCPSSPNCVSTLADATDSVHYLAPLPVSAQPEAVLNAAEAALNAAGAKITQRTDNQIDAIFTSKLFKFKDDVTLLTGEGKLHARSASRTGHSDLGANRKRMDALFAAITQSLN